jgi:hypothetical protein
MEELFLAISILLEDDERKRRGTRLVSLGKKAEFIDFWSPLWRTPQANRSSDPSQVAHVRKTKPTET